MVEFWQQNRNVLAVIGSLLLGLMTVLLWQSIGMMIYPPTQKLDFEQPSTLVEYLNTSSAPAKVILILSYLFGSGTTGYASLGIASKGNKIPFYITSVLVLLGTIMFLNSIPYPGLLAGQCIAVTVTGLGISYWIFRHYGKPFF